MTPHHALIVANGDLPTPGLIAQLQRDANLLIATDGAADRLLSVGITPEVVLGDFDSVSPETLAEMRDDSVVHAGDQEASDLDKAVQFALQKSASKVTILGCRGSRWDHSFTAVSLLLKYEGRASLLLKDDSTECRLVRGETRITGSPGDTVSLIVFDRVEGVTFEGVRWPLMDETLLPGSRGVSNELVGSDARLIIRDGWALLVHMPVNDPR
jgi:thiamine pyrophosphokinase